MRYGTCAEIRGVAECFVNLHPELMVEQQIQPNTEFLSVKQLAARFPFKSVDGWRWSIFNSDQNGLDRAIRKVGGRVVLIESEVVAWIKDQI